MFPRVLQCFIALSGVSSVLAQQEVPLWPKGSVVVHASPETAEDKHETGRLDRYISNVGIPTLTLYPVATGGQPAPAMLVVPGGGFRAVCIDKEGIEPAKWLNAHGITAAVLKYRTLDEKEERSPRTIEPIYADTIRAMRLLRSHAAEWKLDPQHIGVLGFSAGAVMALRLTMDADAGHPGSADPVERADSHPDAVAIIYGGVFGKLKAPAMLPPFFVAHAADDPKAPVGVVSVITKYVQEGHGSFELHVFRRGDHGFGMQPASGTVVAWPELYARWLVDIGFLAKDVTH